MIQIPDENVLPGGSHRNLLVALHVLYRRAGFPGIKSISEASVHLGDNCDVISHQGVSNILAGKSIPRWGKLEALVLVLANRDVTRPEPRGIAQEFHALWVQVASEPTPQSIRVDDAGKPPPEESTADPSGSLAPPVRTRAAGTVRVRRSLSARRKRDLLLEVGGRCPVPRCASSSMEIAHITPLSMGGADAFGNLIYLCANHHRQYDGGDFTEQHLRLIKARLAWNADRYTHAEYLWLGVFSRSGGTHFLHPIEERSCLRFLEADGYIERVDTPGVAKSDMDTWRLTEIGVRLAGVWADSGAPPVNITTGP
ncbi:HNH endonuclease signature motif containing protein [Streptomyces microflavus]|uniref:HNH endonuclease signature motif containing protein n=1 Tax=Streptomyces microflavus TaxID=1919 RepID=UPI003B211FDF